MTGTLAPPQPRADRLPLRDADGIVTARFVQAVCDGLAEEDAAGIKALTEGLHEADLADLIEALGAEDRPHLVRLLGRDFDYAVLTELDDSVREALLEAIPNAAIADGVAELDVDDAVYILEDLDVEDQTEVLQALPATDRVALERSLDYPDGSVGRLMQVDFIAIPPFWTVGDTIDHCREAPDLPDRFLELYLVDPAHKLVGVLDLDRILRAKRPTPVSALASDSKVRVHATDDAFEVAQLFQRYNLLAAPVLDAGDRLVGVLTIDDMVDVIGAEADAEIKALGGVGTAEELSDTVARTTRSRFPWLFVNLVTAVLASVVIGLFEQSLERMVALAVLMPIVASMGGNAATQTMTVAVRALATRELGHANAVRIVRREVLVGLANGVAFALVMGGVAALWFHSLDLGFVIGLALIVVLLFAALGGILIPIALDRLGVDPAVSSGPFVTTVTDVVGFFAFLGFATLWFRL